MSYEVAIDQSKEPVYDNVGELHLGGAQREPLYSDPDRNIILTLDHQRSPQRKRRANLAPELDPEENTENYPLYPFPQQIGAELNQHENPLQNREQDLENEGMESLRGLRDSIMGLNQESFSGAKGESPETFFVRIERHANFGGWNEERKLQAVFLALRGRASDFAETLPAATKADFELIKAALTNHFKVNKSKVLQWEEIQDFSLQPGQTVTSYYDQLSKLATRLGGISDEQLLFCSKRAFHVI